jgi:hypothetical protein
MTPVLCAHWTGKKHHRRYADRRHGLWIASVSSPRLCIPPEIVSCPWHMFLCLSPRSTSNERRGAAGVSNITLHLVWAICTLETHC